MKKYILSIVVCALLFGGTSFAQTTSSSTFNKENNLANRPLNSGNFAYSIGVKHSKGDTRKGDFTKNAKAAARAYRKSPYIDESFVETNPTVDFMLSPQTNGRRPIGSKLVFLNGHGSPTHISFRQESKGDDYITGVAYKEDRHSKKTNAAYAGIADTYMHNVDLISFVGCHTAKGNDNLPYRATKAGAKAAIGFTTKVHSRYSKGPKWLKIYNKLIAEGNELENAIENATIAYPMTDLGDLIKVYRNQDKYDYYNTENSNRFMQLGRSKYPASRYPAQIYVDYTEHDNIFRKNPNYHYDKLEDVMDKIYEINEAINFDNYKVTINMYDKTRNNGLIKFLYYIDGEIKTNEGYVIPIRNGYIGAIYEIGIDHEDMIVQDSNSDFFRAVQNDTTKNKEQELIERVNNFKKQKTLRNRDMLLAADTEIDSVTEEYEYDDETNELKYIKTVFRYKKDFDGEIVADTEEIVIR